METDFEIGVGLIFTKEDLINSLKRLDPDYKSELVYEILDSLRISFTDEDKITSIKSEEALRYIKKISCGVVEELRK